MTRTRSTRTRTSPTRTRTRINITAAGWQVTLCDSIWYANSHSSVVILTMTCYIWYTYLVTNENEKYHDQISSNKPCRQTSSVPVGLITINTPVVTAFNTRPASVMAFKGHDVGTRTTSQLHHTCQTQDVHHLISGGTSLSSLQHSCSSCSARLQQKQSALQSAFMVDLKLDFVMCIRLEC